MKKEYDCQAAILAIALKMANREPYDLRATLAELTDIPADRLDFAASEISQVLPTLQTLCRILGSITDDDAERAEGVRRTIGKASWLDDDRRDLTVRAYRESSEEGEPLVTVKTKLKKAE